MIVDTNSWHCKLWRATYWYKKPDGDAPRHPKTTNLCDYVQRLVFGPPWAFLLLPILMIISLIFGIVQFVLLTTLVVIFENRQPKRFPSSIFDRSPFNNDNLVPCKGVKLGSFVCYPRHFMLPVAIIASPLLSYYLLGGFVTAVVGSTLGVLLLGFGVIAFLCSETGNLIGAYLAAKKQRVCPVVEFADKPTSGI